MRSSKALLERIIIIGAIAAFVTILAALRPSKAAAGACALSITGCGCTITSPGFYGVANDLNMNSPGACIDVVASNVSLSGSLRNITGPGSNTASVGVHVEAAANKFFVESLTLEDFGTGIVIDGPNARAQFVSTLDNNRGTIVNGASALLYSHSSLAENLVGILVNSSATNFLGVVLSIDDSGAAGIKLNGVSGAVIEDAGVGGAGTFGIWLRSASNNVIDGFASESNQIAGVYLGCNPSGPNGTPCPAGVPASNNNTLLGTFYGGIKSNVGSTGSPFSQRYGIAVGVGNVHNNLIGITGDGNTVFNALDENPNPKCSNRWVATIFTTFSAPKGCIPHF